jgi:hypothetical protein
MNLRFTTVANSEITKILRNEHVFIFYDKNNIYSFISCFLINRYFELSNQLQNIHFIPINNPYDIYINRFKFNSELEKGNIIFIDCGITKQVISFYIHRVKRIIVIDDQESSYKVTYKALVDSLYSKESKRKVTFTHTDGFCSPCGVWQLITGDEPIPQIYEIQELYKRHKKFIDLNDFDLLVPTMVGCNFEELENFLFNTIKDISVFKKCFSIVSCSLKNLYSNCLKNSFALKINNLKALCINLNESDDRVLNYLVANNSPLDNDVVVSFTQLEKLTKIIVTTKNIKLDLLSIFSKYNPIGDSDRIYFYSKKPFLQTFK